MVLIGFFRTLTTIRVKDPMIDSIQATSDGFGIIQREKMKKDIDAQDGGRLNKHRKGT